MGFPKRPSSAREVAIIFVVAALLALMAMLAAFVIWLYLGDNVEYPAGPVRQHARNVFLAMEQCGDDVPVGPARWATCAALVDRTVVQAPTPLEGAARVVGRPNGFDIVIDNRSAHLPAQDLSKYTLRWSSVTNTSIFTCIPNARSCATGGLESSGYRMVP